jgi:hypothetical protein
VGVKIAFQPEINESQGDELFHVLSQWRSVTVNISSSRIAMSIENIKIKIKLA